MLLVYHAVKHLGDSLNGYMIYLCFTNGVKSYSTMGCTIGFYMMYTDLLYKKNIGKT